MKGYEMAGKTRRDSNNVSLEKLIEEYGLTNDMVAAMTGYSVNSVKAWRARDVESAKYRPMQDRAMKLLEFEIKNRKLKAFVNM